MARIIPSPPPHDPEKVAVIWNHPSFRSKLTEICYEVKLSQHYGAEGKRQLLAWGVDYIKWRAGRRAAPGQLHAKTVISGEDRATIETALLQHFDQYVAQLQQALDEIASCHAADDDALSELLSTTSQTNACDSS